LPKKLLRLLNSHTSKITQTLLTAAIILTCVLYQCSERYGYRMSGFICLCLGDGFIPPKASKRVWWCTTVFQAMTGSSFITSS